MYRIKLGYDSLLIQYKNKDFSDGKIKKLYALPGFETGDYVHQGIKAVQEYHSDVIFLKSKNDIEKEYNITFPLNLDNNQKIFNKKFLHNSLNRNSTDINMLKKMDQVEIIEDTVDNFLHNNEQFIYPYAVINEQFFLEDIPLPPSKVIKAVKQGKAKIVFFYGAEGHTYNLKKLEKLIEFTRKVDVKVHYYHSNLKLGESYKEWIKLFPNETTRNLIIKRYSAFEIDPWFIRFDKTSQRDVSRLQQDYYKHLQEHEITKKIINTKNQKKFLVFNRRPRLFRSLIHAAIKSDPQLDSNSFTGIEKNDGIEGTINLASANSNKIYKSQEILKYIKDNKARYRDIGYKLDVDLSENQAFSFPLSFYYNTLISVVTETETEPDCVFFTEKIFKPILGLHPFIVVTSPYFLQTLQDEGYKTFNDFWDESYDTITDPFERFTAVLKLITELNSKTVEELTEMYFKMLPIMKHNYNNFCNNGRHTFFLKDLEKYTPYSPLI